MGSRFFKGREKAVQKSDYFSLQAQIAWTIKVFLRVRGIQWLMKPETALVMRKCYEVSLAQDTEGSENRESVIARVYLKDVDCYEEFKTVQVDSSLRNSALGEMTVNSLADQLAGRLLQQAARGHSKTHALKIS